MPLHWNVDHVDYLVTLKCVGALRFPEVMDYLEGMRTARALRYRKLFDAREGYTDMSEHELMWYAGSVTGYTRLDRLGPYAIVVQNNFRRAHGPILHQLHLPPDRPISMFWTPAEAMAWLKAQPISPDDRT